MAASESEEKAALSALSVQPSLEDRDRSQTLYFEPAASTDLTARVGVNVSSHIDMGSMSGCHGGDNVSSAGKEDAMAGSECSDIWKHFGSSANAHDVIELEQHNVDSLPAWAVKCVSSVLEQGLTRTLKVCQDEMQAEMNKPPIVAFVGVTSSGKTTLGNALIGQKLADSQALPNTLLPVHYKVSGTTGFTLSLPNDELLQFLNTEAANDSNSKLRAALNDLGQPLELEPLFEKLTTINNVLRKKLDSLQSKIGMSLKVGEWHAIVTIPEDSTTSGMKGFTMVDCPGGSESEDPDAMAGLTGGVTGWVIAQMLTYQMTQAALVVLVTTLDKVSPLLNKGQAQALFGGEAPNCRGLLVMNSVDDERARKDADAWFDQKRDVIRANLAPLNLQSPPGTIDSETQMGFCVSARTLLCEKECRIMFDSPQQVLVKLPDLKQLLEAVIGEDSAEFEKKLKDDGYETVEDIASSVRDDFLKDADDMKLPKRKAREVFEQAMKANVPAQFSHPEYQDRLELIRSSFFQYTASTVAELGRYNSMLVRQDGSSVRAKVREANDARHSDNNALDYHFNTFRHQVEPIERSKQIFHIALTALDATLKELELEKEVLLMPTEHANEQIKLLQKELRSVEGDVTRAFTAILETKSDRIKTAISWICRKASETGLLEKPGFCVASEASGADSVKVRRAAQVEVLTDQKLALATMQTVSCMSADTYDEIGFTPAVEPVFATQWRAEQWLTQFLQWVAREIAGVLEGAVSNSESTRRTIEAEISKIIAAGKCANYDYVKGVFILAIPAIVLAGEAGQSAVVGALAAGFHQFYLGDGDDFRADIQPASLERSANSVCKDILDAAIARKVRLCQQEKNPRLRYLQDKVEGRTRTEDHLERELAKTMEAKTRIMAWHDWCTDCVRRAVQRPRAG